MQNIIEKLKDIFFLINEKIGLKKIIAIILALLIVADMVIAVVLTNSVFSKNGFADSKKSNEIIDVYLSSNKYSTWLKKKAENCSISGEEDKELNALVLSNYETSHSYVIMCHPFTVTAVDMGSYAYYFYDLGFNVYLPEARGYGESDYRKSNLGYEDYKDIIKWVEYITENDKDAKIFIFGVGMGGTSALLTSDKNLPQNVKGIIADCPYSDLKDLFKHNIKELYNLPAFPTVQFASVYNKVANGWSFGELNVKDCVKNSQVPILYIQAGDDEIVPASHTNDLYDITTARNSDHVLISGAGHCETMLADSEKYWNNVQSFILNTIDL